MSMGDNNHHEKQLLWSQPASRIRWVWVVGSGVGALVGASISLWMYRYIDVLYSMWFFFRFAITIGMPIALSQWLILRYTSRHIKKANTLILFLWIPVTSIGIAFLILPMGFALTPTDYSELAALFTAVFMLPGILFLGLSQWLIMRKIMPAKYTWAVYTILGAVSGLIVGYVVGQLTIELIPIEATWPIVASVIIAFSQCFDLPTQEY